MKIFWMIYPTRGEVEAGFHRVLLAMKETKSFSKHSLTIETEKEKIYFICCMDEKTLVKAPRYDKIWIDERVSYNLDIIETRRK